MSVRLNGRDVDDPFDQLNPDMPNVNVIDNDMNGPDNRGSDQVPRKDTTTTDQCGQARLPITVSMQPGNNYRAAASCIEDVFGGSDPQVDQTDADAKQYDHPDGGNWSGYVTFRIANRHRMVSFHRNTEVTLAKRWDICQDSRGVISTPHHLSEPRP